ncbi:MAG: site-specific integrase [Pseudomonadota bacterium]
MPDRVKLTNTNIRGLNPKSKYYRVWDSAAPGLFVQVYPTGRKTFKFFYRFLGKQKTISMQPFGKLTVEQARSAVKHYEGLIAQKRDPMAEEATAKEIVKRAEHNTLKKFIDGRYGDWLKANRKTGAEMLKLFPIYWPDFMGRPLDGISRDDIERWIQSQLRAGAKPVTVNRKLSNLSKLFSMAFRWELIETNPTSRIDKPQEVSDPRMRHLSPEEEERLRVALDTRDVEAREARVRTNAWKEARGHDQLSTIDGYSDYLAPMVMLALNTGARRGELFALEWQNVDTERKVMTVSAHTAKTQRTRHVPLNAEALDVLERWGEQTGRGGLVFPNPVTGERLTTIKKSWTAVVKDAALEDFRFHDLRHTFASNLVMAGVDLNTVRELLGHSDLTMTLRYSHLAPDHKQSAVEKLVK